MVVEIYRRSLPEQASLEHSAGGRYFDVEELLARRHNIAGYEFQALVGSSRGLRGVVEMKFWKKTMSVTVSSAFVGADRSFELSAF